MRQASRIFALFAAGMVGWGLAIAGDTGAKTDDDLSIWQDPAFERQFLGSYGFNAEVEPSLDEIERTQLQEILAQLQEGDRDGAIAALEAIVSPPEPEPKNAKNKKKRKQQAEEEAGAAEAHNTNAYFHYVLANLYFEEGRLDDAKGQYEAAISAFPSFLRAYKNLGLIRVRSGEWQQAIRALTRVVELGGADGQTWGVLGYSYSNSGQYLQAESAYRNALLLQPEVLDWKLGLTKAVYEQRKYGETVALCDELIALNPEREQFWILQANAYIGMGESLKAAQNFELLARMGQGNVATLNTLGDIYVNDGSWDLAARAYREAMELNPDQDPGSPLRNIEVLAQRGAMNQAQELIDILQRVSGDRLDPEQKKRLLKLEARIAMAQGDDEGNVEVLEEIVALDPLDGEALILLGQHHARTSDPEQAVFYFERAQSIDEYEAEANLRHAQLLVGEGRFDEAIPLLRRTQELEPRDDVARYLEQVERVARTQR